MWRILCYSAPNGIRYRCLAIGTSTRNTVSSLGFMQKSSLISKIKLFFQCDFMEPYAICGNKFSFPVSLLGRIGVLFLSDIRPCNLTCGSQTIETKQRLQFSSVTDFLQPAYNCVGRVHWPFKQIHHIRWQSLTSCWWRNICGTLWSLMQ